MRKRQYTLNHSDSDSQVPKFKQKINKSIKKTDINSSNIKLTTKTRLGKLKRPTNTNIQKQFLKKLRGPKLNCITYQSQLQLQLSSFDQHVKFDNVAQDFHIINSFLNSTLYNNLQAIKQQWKWREIKNQQDLPQLLFTNGDDPCYLIYNLMQKNPIQHKELPKVLFFIVLYILNQRDLLSRQILIIYSNKYQQILQKIKEALLEIHQQYNIQQSFLDKPQQQTINKTIKGKDANENKQDQILFITVNYICWAYNYVSKK